MSRIVVTGGAGFLGDKVVSELMRQGHSLEEIIVPRSDQWDLRDVESACKVFRSADLVIHLAADVGGIGYNRDHPGSIFYNNMLLGLSVLEAARLMEVKKFVGVGTICAYPKYTPVPFKEENLWAGYPEETNAPYGLAKKMLLVQGHAYRQQYGLNFIYLLPTNLYGPGDHFDERAHVIPDLIKRIAHCMETGEDLVVWGDGSASREFLYVEDAAHGIVAAAKAYEGQEPVNLGSGREIRILDLVTLLTELMGYHGTIEWDTTKPNGQPRRQVDTTRAKEHFGFESTTSLEEGLKKTIAWYYANKDKL